MIWRKNFKSDTDGIKKPPKNFGESVKLWECGKLMTKEAVKQSGLTESTFYTGGFGSSAAIYTRLYEGNHKHMKYQWLETHATSKKGAYKEWKQEWEVHRYMLRDKMFIMHGGDSTGKEIITLKLDPAEGQFLRKQYAEWQSVDGCMTKAPLGGSELVGDNPTDREKKGATIAWLLTPVTEVFTRCCNGHPLLCKNRNSVLGVSKLSLSSREN